MRILHVIDSLEVGGAERMLIEIANSAAHDGHEVSACVTRSATTLSGELDPKIKLTVLNRRRRLDLNAMRRVAYEARLQNIDVLHAHGRSTLSFLAAMQTLRMTLIPIVFHDHYGSIEIDQSVPIWFRLWGRHHIAQYVGVSAALGEWAAHAGVARERIHVIGNAIDFRRFKFLSAPSNFNLRKEFSIPDKMPLGVVVGNIRPDKGIDVLLNAIALSRLRNCFKIVLIGGEREASYASQCRAQCSSLGLDNEVLFAGERDAATLAADADFAVLPSRSESGPLVLIEYMALGLPFVATKVGSVGNHVASLGLPEFVAPEDAHALAEAIDNLLKLTSQQRRARGDSGRQTARRHFDIRQAMPQWYAVYDKAIAGSHA